MNSIQYLINRQLGTYSRFCYDDVLKRLVVKREETFYSEEGIFVDTPIFACRFSEAPGCEHILALGSEGGKVTIRDTRKKSAVSSLVEFQGHNSPVFDLAWMPGRKNFVTVSADEKACLWDVSESFPKKLTVFTCHTGSVKTAAFGPTAPSVFATGSKDGNIFICDIRTKNTPTMVVTPDNKIINGYSNYTTKMFKKRQSIGITSHRPIGITSLVFQDDITLLSCSEYGGIIKMWDLRRNYKNFGKVPWPKHSIPYCGSSNKNGYTNLIIDDTRTRLYASCMDSVIYCFNISTYNTLLEQKYIGHESSTFYIKTSLSPDCMYLTSGSSDKMAYIWNVKYSEPIVKLISHQDEVNCAAWCQKGDTKIVTCSDDARHNIWRIGREFPDPEEKLEGNAVVIPRTDVANLLIPTERNLTPLSYSAKHFKAEESSERSIKRCLIGLINASNDNESNERKLLQAGTKCNSGYVETSPAKKEFLETDQTKSPKSETSPTKSPNSTPVKVSLTQLKITSFYPPTEDLRNFVLTSKAPHLKPLKEKQHTKNWLTLMGEERKAKEIANKSKKNVSSPRISIKKKTKSSIKSESILKYFRIVSIAI